MRWIRFKIKWWRWFLSGPLRIKYSLDAEGSRNWHIAMERWVENEPIP